MTEDRPVEGLGSWRVRRAYMFSITLFCMASVAYVLASGQDTRVGETVIMMAFGTMASVTGAYVFTASWQDVSMDRTRHQGRPTSRGRVDNPEDR